jgi:hypothetical protein
MTPVNYHNLTEHIFSVNAASFEALALDCFRMQYERNTLYHTFCGLLRIKPEQVNDLHSIPFLPIELFKTRRVISAFDIEERPIVFTSSGTTSSSVSKHFVNDLSLYEKSFKKSFSLFYGTPAEYCILALLPSYVERGGSSLVYMAQKLIEQSADKRSGFYNARTIELKEIIASLKKENRKTILFGVSYSLLDLAEENVNLAANFVVMETGGMKGRREELPKSELHEILIKKLQVREIHSEYGMTELLSQAYSKGNGFFETPPWMKILVRDANDPFAYLAAGRTGGINVIDLANINSCCFIATKDLGRMQESGNFEIMGRFDNSDIRGCNLLVNG